MLISFVQAFRTSGTAHEKFDVMIERTMGVLQRAKQEALNVATQHPLAWIESETVDQRLWCCTRSNWIAEVITAE
jgi:hypothetical protein